jgi:hypothetical protein
MVNRARTRSYTRIARRYNLACLILITVGSIAYIVLNALGTYATSISVIETFRSAAVVGAGILAIYGIVGEKPWARWLIIAIYSLYLFLAIQGIINSFFLKNTFSLLSSNTLIVVGMLRLIAIAVLLVGIILLLKKPRREENESEI